MIARIMLLLAITASPAMAQNTEADELASQLVQTAFGRMALAYLCRDAVGLSHYQAARIAAEGAIATIGFDRDRAVLDVDTMDQKFKNDPRAAFPKADAGKCLEKMNELSQQFKVVSAKLRRAEAKK